MTDQFFDQPILNSPYEYPSRHWELDASGQPTSKIIDKRRPAEFITPIPKPKKRKGAKNQQEMVFDEGQGLSTAEQQYDTMGMVNEVRLPRKSVAANHVTKRLAGHAGDGKTSAALAAPQV